MKISVFFVLSFDVEELSKFREALERVEELRIAVPVEVHKIAVIDGKIKVVLRVPDDSVELVKNALPGGVVAA